MPSWGFGLSSYLNRKVVDPLLQIIRRGAEPKQLAFSTALGAMLGLFPVCGVTVFLCGIAIALLRSRCHAASVMLANFVVTPLEISLVIPFLRLGEVISGGPHFQLNSDAFKKVVTGQASREVLLAIWHASRSCARVSFTSQVAGGDAFINGGEELRSTKRIARVDPEEIIGWSVAAPFIVGVLYTLLVPCFKYLIQKFKAGPSTPKKQPYPHDDFKIKIRDV